jgi:hypothetical protein
MADVRRQVGVRLTRATGAESYTAPDGAGRDQRIEGRTNAALDWLERGYRAGWKRAGFLTSTLPRIGQEPRYQALTAGRTQDVAEIEDALGSGSPLAVQPGSGC